VYQPADGGDLAGFLFPTYRFAAAELAAGRLPLWNPHLYAGAPFIGDIQAGFLYLPNLALFLLWPDFSYVALQWMAVGHIAWAGLGMYVLLRALRLGGLPISRPAALFGALAFMFSDPLLTHLGNLNLIAVLSWLPWVLAAFQRALATRSLRWAAVAALLFALGSYAGHAQSSFYVGLALAAYALLWAVTRRAGRIVLYPLGHLAVTSVLTLLLTAPILLPAVELAQRTARTNFTYQESIAYSLAPAQLVGLLTPSFYGRGPALHWSLWERVETPYLGVAALLMAVAALPLADRRERRALAPWLGTALLGLAVALGVYGIVHGWLTALIPGFGLLRAPARALVLWSLGGSVLAAAGLDFAAQRSLRGLPALYKWGALVVAGVMLPLSLLALLLTQESETAFLRASLVALALSLAALFWLAAGALVAARRAGMLSAQVFAGLMAALLFLDLAAAGAYTDISPADPTVGFAQPEIAAFLAEDPGLFRIDTLTEIRDLWQPDAAALLGLQDVGGVANPLALQSWTDYWGALGGRDAQGYHLLNAKYAIARDGTELPAPPFELAFDAPGPLSVFRNAVAAPRAWLSAADATAPLPDPALPPVTVESYAPGRIVLRAAPDGPATLVLSEVDYPGWRATVNGAPAVIETAFGLLRAVALPGGPAQVVFTYAPDSFTNGLLAAAVGLLAAIVLIVVGRPRRRGEYP
jgi:hypothetical protein